MPDRPPAVVLIYRRDGCHLCDEARRVVADVAAGRRRIELRETDIEDDDALLKTYLERIPVVEIDGVVVSELAPDVDAIERALGTFEK